MVSGARPAYRADLASLASVACLACLANRTSCPRIRDLPGKPDISLYPRPNVSGKPDMLSKPCQICGIPTKSANARCQQHKRGTAAQRGYDKTYRTNRDIVVRYWRTNHLPCFICGRQIDPKEPITAEHVLPLSRGGSSAVGNLRGAHAHCNYGHGGKPGQKRS